MDFDEVMENRRLNRSRYPLLANRQMVGGTWLLSACLARTEDPSLNYYERHLGDYAKDTAHLSMLEHGAYTLLMDRYYATEAGIPQDQAYRVTRAQSKAERAAVDSVLREFFSLNDGVWIKGRCEAVIADHHAFIEKQRASGRASAAKRSFNAGSTVVEQSLNSGSTKTQPPTPTPTPTLNPKSQDPAPPAPVLDPRKALFDLGVSILGEKKRSLIGKAISEVGESKVAEIIGAMAAKPPVDPGAYFAAATQPKVRGVQC